MAKERKNFIYFFLLFSLSVFAQATFVKQNKNAVVKKNFVQSLQSSRDQFYVYHIRYFSIYASDSLFFCFWFVSQPAYIAFFYFSFLFNYSLTENIIKCINNAKWKTRTTQSTKNKKRINNNENIYGIYKFSMWFLIFVCCSRDRETK